MHQKKQFFEGYSWCKFNNSKWELTLCMALKSYYSMGKGVKLKFRKCLAPIATFVEVTREKLVWGFFLPPPPWWWNIWYVFAVCCTKFVYSWKAWFAITTFLYWVFLYFVFFSSSTYFWNTGYLVVYKCSVLFEILGWCPAGSVLPHGEKLPL